jgi:transitional endoplasmic reticulum ATPase
VIAKAVGLAASRETSEGDVLGSVIAVAAAMGIRGAQVGVVASRRQVIDPRLVNSDVDVVAMAEALKRSRARRISFCVGGPSGTGKSAWVRYLAEQLGFEVLTKRASDLLDRYVGSTEKNIVRMFEEACDLGAFIVLDEADSLLRDRKSARYSWEVTFVNEMLTWMEQHPLPFACTTNLIEALDEATARRFTFKVKFDYLRPEQQRQACEQFFGRQLNFSLEPHDAITVGDFDVVHRKAEALGQLNDDAALAGMLEAEIEHRGRERPHGRRIGF